MFTVRAKSRAATVTCDVPTALAAMRKAAELVAEGMCEVRIIDPRGQEYDHEDFGILFLKEQTGGEGDEQP